MAEDYGDILLKAVKTVVDGVVEGLQFDKTVICKITNNAKADKGEYTVNDGSSTFLAYTDNTEYPVGQSVYVTIPNGDYAKQKMITGKYMATGGDYYTYTSPWKNFVDITGDLIADDSSANSASILANGKVIDNYSTEQSEEILLKEYKVTDGKKYTCIGLKADFRAWLSGLGAEFGTYGLRLYIRTVNKNLGGTNKYQTTKAELSTLDMYGNPYAFESYYNQQKIFDISGLGELYSISLYLYQKNDFYDANNNLISHTRENEQGQIVNLDNNIFVNNIYLALGYSIEDFDGDMVLLYTLDPDTYSSEYGRGSEENIKHLMVRWVHEDDNGNIIGYTDSAGLGESARIHWYKYRLDQNVFDELAGSFWEEIPEWQDSFEQEIDCFDSISQQEIRYKVIVESPVKDYLLRDIKRDESVNNAQTELDQAETSYEIAKDAYRYDPTEVNEDLMNQAKEAYEAAVDKYNSVTEIYTADVGLFESNELVLTNEQQVADLATLDLIQSLSLDVDPDGYKGIYTLYDQTNQIQNATEANKIRTITANYKSTITGDTDLDAAESITWMIPLANTMIQKPEDGKEFDSSVDEVTETEDGQFMMIKRDGKEHTGFIGTSFANSAVQYFRIKNYFTESATNNTVTCYVIKDHKTYEASFNMSFGPMGTNGTDFTFVLSMESDRTCLFKQDCDPVQINATLYDYNNNEVPHGQNAPITYSWLSQDDIVKIGFCNEVGDLYDSNQEIIEDGKLTKDSRLLRYYRPLVDANDTHMYCYIRRLTNYEIATLNGIAENDLKVEDTIPFFYILQASSTINALSEKKALGKVMLDAYLAIPYSGNYDFTQISGTTKIVYNSAGTSPYYYKDKYKLYSYSDPVDGVTWDEKNGAKTVGERKFYPKIDDDGSIVVPSNYVKELSSQVAAVAYKEMDELDENGQVKVANERPVTSKQIVWTQPIMIFQNAYSSEMLNAWDGSLTIDEEKGTIMSSMLGAGYKDAKNRYNGVLIGDVTKNADTGAGTGMFGYSEGVQSFGFKIDGTAFIGKSGKGQIQFDGNSGLIQSMSYKNGQSGMKIDLDDGAIEMRGNQITRVVNKKAVEIVDVTDFSDDLTDIYGMIDGKKIEGDAELTNAIQLLQQYNGVKPKDMTDEELYLVESALEYIRATCDEVHFKDELLDDYLETIQADYNAEINAINNQIADLEALANRLKQSSQNADKEDANKALDLAKELAQERTRLQRYISELQNYAAVSRDMSVFQAAQALQAEYYNLEKKASALREESLDYQNLAKHIDAEIKDLNNRIASADNALTKATKQWKSISATDEHTTAIKRNYESEKDYLSQVKTDLLTEKAALQAKYNDAIEQSNHLKAEYESYISNTGSIIQAKQAYLDKLNELEVKKSSIINYKDIIDEESVKADLQAYYKSLPAEDRGDITMDAFVAAHLDDAVQETYYALLASSNPGSILPTQLVNSTETTPEYETTRSQVRLATESPYFKVVDEFGQNLVMIADNNYYLQSSGYNSSTNVDGSGGKGVCFDLKKGLLNGYNFSFKSALSSFIDEDPTASQFNGSYISIGSMGTSTDPFLRVHYVKWNDGQTEKETDIHLLDITRTNFVMHSQNWKSGAEGMELNLTKGTLKAFSGFNLKAKSPNNGSYIQLSSEGNPYFRVHHESDTQNLDLINITDSTFMIQSQNWISGTSGLQMNLTKGTFKAYDNFSLISKITNGTYNGSYIQLTADSGATYPLSLIVHYTCTNSGDASQNNNLDIFKITHQKFFLRSHDWGLKNTVNANLGMELDLEKGKITAYSFTIKAFRVNTNDQYVSLDSTATTYPLRVYGKYTENGTEKTGDFKVGWDGKVHANYLEATEGGKIGPFYFDNDAFWTGTKSMSGSGIYIHKTSGFGVSSGKFTVDGSGNLSVNSGKFYVANTGETTIKASTHIDGDLYISGKIVGNNWQVDGTSAGSAGGVSSSSLGKGGCAGFGNINAKGGKIGNWIIGTDKGELKDTSGTVILDPNTPQFKCGNVEMKEDRLIFNSNNNCGVWALDGHIYIDPGDGMGISIGDKLLGAALSKIICAELEVSGGGSRTGDASIEGKVTSKGGYYAGDSKGITGKVKFKEGIIKKGELSFKDGLLISGTDEHSGASTIDDTISTDEAKAIIDAIKKDDIVKKLYTNYASGSIGTNRLGKLAWKDDVEISSASFNLGGSALSVGRPTVSGDTATYKVTIPGQRYSAGSSERAHAYAWVDENDALHVTCTTGSAPAGYSASTNKKTAHDSCSAGSGGSGTTASRTLTAKITVKAT